MTLPGKKTTLESVLIYAIPSEIMAPNSGSGGATPIPRKPREDISRTAFPHARVAITQSVGISLGKTYFTRSIGRGNPASLAASTYGLTNIPFNSERTIRK